MERGSAASGLLMGGAEHGELYIWDPAKIVLQDDALVHKFSKHTGPVVALDINPFQVCQNYLSAFNLRYTFFIAHFISKNTGILSSVEKIFVFGVV